MEPHIIWLKGNTWKILNNPQIDGPPQIDDKGALGGLAKRRKQKSPAGQGFHRQFGIGVLWAFREVEGLKKNAGAPLIHVIVNLG